MDQSIPLEVSQYARHNEIRALINETIQHFDEAGHRHFREWQIFFSAMGDSPETDEAFLRFLHDVSTCPQEVINWCEWILEIT